MTTDALMVARAWVAALATAILVALWALLARTPFPAQPAPASSTLPTTTPVAAVDPRIVALQRRERALRLRARAVQRRHALRWAAYRQAVRERDAQAAAATTFVWSGTPSAGTSAAAPAPAPPPVQTRSS